MLQRNMLKQRQISINGSPQEKWIRVSNESGMFTASPKHRLLKPDTLSSAVGVDALLIPVVVGQE